MGRIDIWVLPRRTFFFLFESVFDSLDLVSFNEATINGVHFFYFYYIRQQLPSESYFFIL